MRVWGSESGVKSVCRCRCFEIGVWAWAWRWGFGEEERVDGGRGWFRAVGRRRRRKGSVGMESAQCPGGVFPSR